MRRIVQQWVVVVGVGVGALVVGAAAASLPGVAGAPTVMRAADDCSASDCGSNHNQVLV